MRRLIPPLLLLAVLGGGLLVWSQLRRPRDLKISLDLTAALPGDVKDVDVIVRRGGHALARHFVRYGVAGAPGTVGSGTQYAIARANCDSAAGWHGELRIVSPDYCGAPSSWAALTSARGSVNEKVEPLPTSLVTDTSPPCASTMLLTMFSPRPRPCSRERASRTSPTW